MTHLNEEDLVLHYYGEGGRNADSEGHLQACPECASTYDAISKMLTRVTIPKASDPGDAFWLRVQKEVPERLARRNRNLALLVWLVPLAYPLSPSAIFYSAQLERGYTAFGIPLMVLVLMWAFAGPFVALFALKRIQGSRMNRTWHRLVVYGALAATISPALFNLTSRTGSALAMWYVATALVAAAALLPVSEATGSTRRLRRAHRTSALLILVFAAAHVANHAFAIVNIPAHSAVLDILRVVYRQSVIELLLLAAIALQVGTGGALVWQAHVRRPSVSTSVQMLSGMYLAVFFLAHVSAALMARPDTDTNFVWAAGESGLLASPRLTFLLPYYLLGVVALFAHVGQYLRIRLLGFMPAVSVRRLSYAGMAFGGVVVVTLGLALCGIHLVP